MLQSTNTKYNNIQKKHNNEIQPFVYTLHPSGHNAVLNKSYETNFLVNVLINGLANRPFEPFICLCHIIYDKQLIHKELHTFRLRAIKGVYY